jgi:diguanylate cyclase (GGDEF)-like protein
MPFLDKRGRWFWGAVGFVLVVFFGIVDYWTGVELSITLFYLLPIFLVAWFADENLAFVISAASTITWFTTDIANGLIYSNITIYVWNTLIRLGFFIISSRLLSELRRALRTNQKSARVDYVTGALSVRYFHELVQGEISRQQRYKHPLTLAYIDLDNFKTINDRLGHITGDKVLRAVTESIQRYIRPSDILARLGGDEFALLLPETGEDEVKRAIDGIHTSLVNEMLRNGWMVTFSISVVTYNQTPKSVDKMVKLADNVMYSVKTTTKNGVCYSIFEGKHQAAPPLPFGYEQAASMIHPPGQGQYRYAFCVRQLDFYLQFPEAACLFPHT